MANYPLDGYKIKMSYQDKPENTVSCNLKSARKSTINLTLKHEKQL